MEKTTPASPLTPLQRHDLLERMYRDGYSFAEMAIAVSARSLRGVYVQCSEFSFPLLYPHRDAAVAARLALHPEVQPPIPQPIEDLSLNTFQRHELRERMYRLGFSIDDITAAIKAKSKNTVGVLNWRDNMLARFGGERKAAKAALPSGVKHKPPMPLTKEEAEVWAIARGKLLAPDNTEPDEKQTSKDILPQVLVDDLDTLQQLSERQRSVLRQQNVRTIREVGDLSSEELVELLGCHLISREAADYAVMTAREPLLKSMGIDVPAIQRPPSKPLKLTTMGNKLAAGLLKP